MTHRHDPRTASDPGYRPAPHQPSGRQPAQRSSPERAQQPRRPELRLPELRINPIACDAHGVCIELLPELISPDPWGYPILETRAVPLRLEALARRAVADCPTLALVLVVPD